MHLALLPTNEDRAKAVVDWAGAGFTHQRAGRITVETGRGRVMADATAEFFDALAERGHEPLLERRRARCGSTSETGRRRSAGSSPSSRATSRSRARIARADCVVSADKALFDGIASGKTNAMAALLRGAMSVEGDVQTARACSSGSFPGRRLPQAAPHHGSCEEEAMSNGLVQILDGNTFVVSDVAGDIEASLTDPTGLFSFDTRFLSKWVLTVDGQRLNALSVDDLQYFETRFFLVPGREPCTSTPSSR